MHIPSSPRRLRGGGEVGPIETVLRGLEARQEPRPFAGRALFARQTNIELEEKLRSWEPFSNEEPMLDVGLTEFKVRDGYWCQESRQVVNSGLNPLGLGPIVTGPGMRLPLRLDDLYRLDASDGERVYHYDRVMNTLTVSTASADSSAVGLTGAIFLATVSDAALGLMRSPERMHVEIRGQETIQGVSCYVLLAVGKHADPKGYLKLWVAPSRDFGVTRLEHVETDRDGEATTCDITRNMGWMQEAATGLWIPQVSQMDCYRYARAGLGCDGWAWSTLDRLDYVSCAEADVQPPWLPPFPFDTKVVNGDAKEWAENPTVDVAGILSRVRFKEPDQLGEAVKDADPSEVYK